MAHGLSIKERKEIFDDTSKKYITKLERENAFFIEQLKRIANRKRHTIEQRLAKSALIFWDELKHEALVTGQREGGWSELLEIR